MGIGFLGPSSSVMFLVLASSGLCIFLWRFQRFASWWYQRFASGLPSLKLTRNLKISCLKRKTTIFQPSWLWVPAVSFQGRVSPSKFWLANMFLAGWPPQIPESGPKFDAMAIYSHAPRSLHDSPLSFGSIRLARWWQLKYFLFSPRKLGKIPILTSIFFKWVETTN